MPLLGGIRQRLGLAPWVRRGRGHGPGRGHVVPIAGQAPDDDDDEDGDFKDFVAELFVCNTVTGPVTQKLYRKAGRAGAEGVSELGKVGNSGKAVGNIHRDLMRKLMKGCTFPEPYWCLVPFLNKETGEEEMHETPVLLPHEVFAWFVEKDPEKIALWRPTPGHTIFHHAERWCEQFDVDIMHLIPLGIHGDGVPFAATMRDTLECISCNILTDKSGVRILYTTFPKSFSAGQKTWDALFRVFAWSMRHLMLGLWPRIREDRMGWRKNEDFRARMSGQGLGFHAAVLQVRGDWAFYKETFAFPHWQAKQCCWKCFAGILQGRWVISEMQLPMLHGGTEGYLGMSSLHCRLQRASRHPVCLNAQGCQWIW